MIVIVALEVLARKEKNPREIPILRKVHITYKETKAPRRNSPRDRAPVVMKILKKALRALTQRT